MAHPGELLLKAALRDDEDPIPAALYAVSRSPEMAAAPAGALVGATLDRDSKLRGAVHGLLTGAGAAGGAALGRALVPQNQAGGVMAGLGLGGLASYLAAKQVVDALFPGRAARLRKQGGVLDDLKGVKAESDRKNYNAKHTQLRELINRYPDDFVIDSRQGDILGITHTPTGFRMHVPQRVLPRKLQETTKAVTTEGAGEPATP